MTNWIQADPRHVSLGTKVRRGWTLVGKFRCDCGQHDQGAFIGVWKKGGSYLLQRVWDDRRRYEHLTHPLHAKYDPAHWEHEMKVVWGDLKGHTLESEVLPRPKGVRFR